MLLLVRHGEATANAAGLLLGRADVALTAKGRAQAERLRGRIGPATRLIASPLRRTRDTAAELCLDVPVEVDDRWVEIDYGEYEGRSLHDVTADVWARWRADPAFCPPGGESLAGVGRRVAAACDELFAVDGAGARDPAGDVVVVSHVSPIKAAVAWALRMDDSAAWRLHLATGSVSRIGWSAGAPVVHTFNSVPD